MKAPNLCPKAAARISKDAGHELTDIINDVAPMKAPAEKPSSAINAHGTHAAALCLYGCIMNMSNEAVTMSDAVPMKGKYVNLISAGPVARKIPAAKGRTNPANSLSAVISSVFHKQRNCRLSYVFAKVVIYFYNFAKICWDFLKISTNHRE